MAWLKIDDGEGMAPWVLEVGNEAYGVYVRLGSYAAQHLTDGRIPGPVAEMIAAGTGDALARLEVVQRITRLNTGTVDLPHYLEHNPSRAQVEADREQRAARARKAAHTRWNGRSGRRTGRDDA